MSIHNIPYCFYSSDVINILAIEFKEFISNKHHVIKKCKNCGRYFIPEDLRDIKYCNNIFKNNKTCKQLEKQISYKKSLKDDKLLDMYRKGISLWLVLFLIMVLKKQLKSLRIIKRGSCYEEEIFG